MLAGFSKCLCLMLLSYVIFGAEEKLDLYEQAAKCPHRFQMGCMLDVIEKSCYAYEFIEACANRGQCENLKEELGGFIAALEPETSEEYHRCCCFKVYKPGEGYENCKNPKPVCMKAFADHVDNDVEKHVHNLRKCYQNPNQSTCTEAIGNVTEVNAAFQKARGALWYEEGCQILAPPEPISKCGWHVQKPEPRSIERIDLYCDTIIWQYKEMGEIDPFLHLCKGAPVIPQKQTSNKIPDEL